MFKKYGIRSLLLLCILPVFKPAAQPVGQIVYLEGDVEIVRDGESMDYDDIDIGMKIENYDLISTSPQSRVSIKINYPAENSSEIAVEENTTFAIEIEDISQATKTSVNMYAGGLSLKVKKLTGHNTLDVHTEAASMGVRGTNFNVETSPGGDLLVSCDEGKVECTSSSGKKLYAQPGKIVEQLAEADFRNVVVAVSDLKKFRRDWNTEKLEVFKADALRAVRQYATRYDDLYNKFNTAYDALMVHKAIISKWHREDKEGKTGGTMELMRDKKQLIGKLLKLRSTLVIFEKIYFRLVELKRYYGQGYGKGNIKTGLNAKSFFDRFEREQKELKRKMAVVKHVTKMYARRNGGSFPADGLSGDDDDFFGDEKDLF